MLNAFLVALAVFICVGGAELIGFTMLNRPIVIGPLVGLLLGDLHTGVIIGASLEAVFMGVVNIGGASAAEPGIATAVGIDNYFRKNMNKPKNMLKKDKLSINIIYVKSNQSYFTYDSDTGNDKNQIIDPIAVIYTVDGLLQ